MNILVTGGAGYIGSHTCVELLEQGMDVTTSSLSIIFPAAIEQLSRKKSLFTSSTSMTSTGYSTSWKT